MKGITPAKVTLLMFLAVGCLVAAYVAKGLMAEDEAPPVVESRNIPMAIADLKPGTVIRQAHIGDARIKASLIKAGTLLNAQGVVGRVVRKAISAATPIHSSDLFAPGERPPLKVTSGMRGVTVNLGDRSALVGGNIGPGQYVDVHMTVTGDTGIGRRIRGGLTLTLFKGVKILSINRDTQSSGISQAGNSITLELTPEQSNIVKLAEDRGKLTLSLNPDGKGTGVVGVSSEDRATLEEILGLKAEPEPPQPFITESYRGSSRSVLRFRDGRRVEASAGDSSRLLRSDQRSSQINPDRAGVSRKQAKR